MPLTHTVNDVEITIHSIRVTEQNTGFPDAIGRVNGRTVPESRKDAGFFNGAGCLMSADFFALPP
ncbi:hypothetical protein DQX05_29460 [Paenibacillus thiaminolyticus]|uniref:Uncharacterized protein n=1 Tax=Paenibacillus thiaminolyticus TaxID=49283 RepID=A0A3A3GAW9_PANTH|nr:hypothetical protein DQX05_29460 [Paenibacillus thiaminolyticus]